MVVLDIVPLPCGIVGWWACIAAAGVRLKPAESTVLENDGIWAERSE